MRTRLVSGVVAAVLAVVGTLVLVGYVRDVEARAVADTRTVNVLVVSEPIAHGTPAEELGALVSSEAVPARVVAAGSVASLDQVHGRVTTVDLQPGEQLLASRFADPAELRAQGAVEIPPGMHQVTVSLEAQRALGGQLNPGDTVGVFVSMGDGVTADGGEPGATTHLLLHKVLVTSVQGGLAPPAPEPSGEDGVPQVPLPATGVGLLVTFAANAADAERLVFAAEHGTVWLSREPTDASADGTRVQTKDGIYR